MDNLIAYVKAHWMRLSLVIGSALIVASVAAALYALGARRDHAPADEAGTPAVSVLPKAKSYSDLYAVSIDNHKDARPPSGVNQAAFVYEVPVEGDITRFLAVFERGMSVPEIGPVRSARPYLIDIVSELGPSLFVHFGGSPEALSRLSASAALREIDRDGISNAGSYFRRDDKRSAPHNAYTSSTDVESMFASRPGASRTVTPWLMVPDPDPSARGAASSFTVPMSKSDGYSPEWRYDPARNVYSRYLSGKTQSDRAGKPIEAKNVVVMNTTSQVLDGEGRLSVMMSGSGDATVYHDGKVIPGIWKNDAGGSPVRFYAQDGAEVPLTEGNVWIEVVGK